MEDSETSFGQVKGKADSMLQNKIMLTAGWK